MPLILPGNVASATASTTYDVDNSCRFNDGDAPKLNRTLGTATSRKKWTMSFWVKRGTLTNQMIMTTASANSQIKFDDNHRFQVNDVTTIVYVTNRLFRDVSAWYHIVIAVDTTDGTAGDRIKIYVNGVEETSFATETDPSVNYDCDINNAIDHKFASYDGSTDYAFDGYLAEVVFIDGLALAPTEFGEFDSDSPTIWKPIDVSGLTFGTNGFYLSFSDSADLGADSSGNSNDFTSTNLDATDSATDVPTNNFATLNILDNAQSDATYSEGNLKWATTTNSHYFWGRSTIGMSAGKWYFEAKLTSAAEHNGIGICVDGPDDNTTYLAQSGVNDEFEWLYKNNTGNQHNDSGSSSYGDSYTTGDIIGVYLDLDNNKLYFAKNGTIQNSGTGISITAPASTSTGNYFFCISDRTNGSSTTLEVNFGGCPAFAISSGNTDANDYGNFEYDPSDGGGSSFDSAAKDFLALCTKNLGSDGG